MKERPTIFLFLSMVMFVGVADAQQVEFSGGGAVTAGIPATLGTCSTGHSLAAANDMLVCGKLEVDGNAWFDAATQFYGKSYVNSEFLVRTSSSSDSLEIRALADDGVHFSAFATDGFANNNFMFVPYAHRDHDFDHDTPSTNPTVFIHSNNDPDTATNNTQWLSLTHDQTDGVISTGLGSVKVGGATGTTLVNGLAVSQEAVACTAGNECTIGTNVITTLLTAGTNAADDAVAIADGVDGQRRTFVLVDGTDDIVITPSTGTATTLEDAGDSVTYEYDATTDTWWRISGCGI